MEAQFIAEPTRLIIVAIVGLIFLLFMIMKMKLHSLLAILIAAGFIGFGSGMPAELVLQAYSDGIKNTLASIALIVGLGSIFGGLLSSTGAAQVLANTMVKKFGSNKAIIAVGITSLIVGIPVFYDAAFIILLPLVFQVARATGKPLLTFVIPFVSGIGLSQMIPPTPGPIIISGQIGADLGLITIYGIIVVIPSWIIAGYLFGKLLGNRIHIPIPELIDHEDVDKKDADKTVSFGTVLAIVLSPIILILLNTGTSLIQSDSGFLASIKDVAGFIGEPFIALIIANLLAIYFLGSKNGFSKEEIEKIMTKALNPVALIILVTAAGGVIRYMLDYSGTAVLLGNFFTSVSLPIIVIAFIISAALRVAVGSAVVSMTMTSGILAALPQMAEISPSYLALVALTIAAGATSFSHVNDSGFWLFKEYMKIDLKTTFKTWTTYTGIASIITFGVIFIVSLFVG